jgi:hypothetical protein
MGRVGPARRRFVRYYKNPVFRGFFHALPEKIGSYEAELSTGMGFYVTQQTQR